MLQSVEVVENWGVDDEDGGIGSEGNELEVDSDGVEFLSSKHEDAGHGDDGDIGEGIVTVDDDGVQLGDSGDGKDESFLCITPSALCCLAEICTTVGMATKAVKWTIE